MTTRANTEQSANCEICPASQRTNKPPNRQHQFRSIQSTFGHKNMKRFAGQFIFKLQSPCSRCWWLVGWSVDSFNQLAVIYREQLISVPDSTCSGHRARWNNGGRAPRPCRCDSGAHLPSSPSLASCAHRARQPTSWAGMEAAN